MRHRFTTTLFLIALGLLQVSCGAGGSDDPFIFPPGPPTPEVSPPPSACESDQDCEDGESCQDGRCVAAKPCETDDDCDEGERCEEKECIPETRSCENDEACGDGKICEEELCITGCRSDTECPSGQVCGSETHLCTTPIPENTCDVTFDAKLELRADAPDDDNDITPICGTDDDPYPTSSYTDLTCCTEANFGSPGTDPRTNETRECEREGHLAIIQEEPSRAMKLKFSISDSGCTVFLAAADFPAYEIDNSALQAALILDAGASVSSLPLRGQVAVSSCSETANGIEIQGLPLQFMARLYENFTRCELVIPGTPACVGNDSFTRWFTALVSPYPAASEPPPADSIQVLPGLGNQSFLLTTGSASASPREGTSNVAAKSTSGIAMHRDPDGKTRMRLAIAWLMPVEDTNPDPETGRGQLTGPLHDAVMTAELEGVVTNPNKPDGTILSLADLRANCGSTVGGQNALNLSATLTVPVSEGPPIEDELPVSGDVTNGFTVGACLPGFHVGGNCTFLSTPELPFAREDGDPLFPETADRFKKRAELRLRIEEGSNLKLELNVPDEIGPIKILNAASLDGFTLNTADNINTEILLELEYNPTEAGEDETTLTISDNPPIEIEIAGMARSPAPELKVEEIAMVPPFAASRGLIPGEESVIEFPEQIIGVQSDTRLLRVSNTGVRTMTVTELDVQDRNFNFRRGSVYQGEDFADRVWRSNQSSWSITPDGESDLFLFLTYGPFANLATAVDPESGETLRHDASALKINATGLGASFVDLTGTAKLDRRATLALYISDENRFAAVGSCGENCKDDLATGEHHYVAENQLFSFRQDGAGRSVYLRNDAEAALEPLRVESQPVLEETVAGKFTIDFETIDYPITLAPQESRKIATIQFDDAASDLYQVFDACLKVAGFSVNAAGGTTGPVIGGGESTAACATGAEIGFSLKGANGAPGEAGGGERDLIIHRLLSGMDSFLATTNQNTLIATTTTQGVLERAGVGSISRYLEKFTLRDGIILDPVAGTAILKPVFTDVDTSFANPTNTTASGFRGIRLFNGPGSLPVKKEYRFQCEASDDPECGYIYGYISDWSDLVINVVPTGSGCVSGKAAIHSGPIATDTGVMTNVLNPQDPDEAGCMETFLNSVGASRGKYDPVTGEITFPSLAIRLFDVDDPYLGKDVDSVLHLALTTECVTAGRTPDLSARVDSNDLDTVIDRLVPDVTFNDNDFDATLMGAAGGANPIALYTGGPCLDPRELHGRRMQFTDAGGTPVNLDTTALFDPGSGDPVGPLNLDLAGVGRISATVGQANGKMMYIIIKAEVCYRCSSGECVASPSMCGAP